ncbi:hypothetical protein [Algoriphagus confluentis]|uniref:Uncharacterized protein n=1 Tax=Algoriphagus confluentis TaxID=1697556 RepID=A0ABQ6PJT7_9BACT|nr:hypothetical protein Aconfl_01770 [Algoriphagus confluentis]
MKIIRNEMLKKIGFALLVLGMSLGTSQNTFANQPNNQPESVEIKLEIEGLDKKFPTIILVDKELKVKAEFYGEREEIQKEFGVLLEKTELLLEHNNHKIYLITR